MKPTTVIYDPVDLPEGRTLTLAIQVEPRTEVTYLNTKGKEKTIQAHYINVGYSIKNPVDGMPIDNQLATTIAKGRAESGTPIFTMVSKGARVSKKFVDNLAKLVETEFKERFHNYIPLSDAKHRSSSTAKESSPEEQSREVTVGLS